MESQCGLVEVERAESVESNDSGLERRRSILLCFITAPFKCKGGAIRLGTGIEICSGLWAHHRVYGQPSMLDTLYNIEAPVVRPSGSGRSSNEHGMRRYWAWSTRHQCNNILRSLDNHESSTTALPWSLD